MKDKIVAIVLSIILFLVPTLIVPNSSNNYNLLKIVVLLICGLVLLIILLTRIKELKFDVTDIFVLIFGFIAIISTIFSVDIQKSIIGANNRYEGILSIITYILIYYNAKYYFKSYNKFINMGLIVYTLICILSIIQFYVKNNIVLIPLFGKGANGTFGNTNFMGNFVSIILPAFLLGYIFSNKKKYLIASILGFCAMIMCVARSSWVAFIIYSILILIYLVIKKDKDYFKKLLILVIGFVLCFTIITGKINIPKFTKHDNETSNNQSSNNQNSNNQPSQNAVTKKIEMVSNEIEKIKDVGITDKMGSGRIEIWRNTLNLLVKVPILGCGVDALQEGLQKFCAYENFKYIYKYNQYIDKAHNEYLQIAVTIGIPALVIYLGFLGLIVFPNIKKSLKDRKALVLSIIIISYLAQAFFNISTIGVAPIFWFILGVASKHIKGSNINEDIKE